MFNIKIALHEYFLKVKQFQSDKKFFIWRYRLTTSSFHEFWIYTKIIAKELSFCHKLWFSHFNIFTTQCQTSNSVGSNNLSLKYQWFTSSGFKDIEFRKFEFVARTQFLYSMKCKKKFKTFLFLSKTFQYEEFRLKTYKIDVTYSARSWEILTIFFFSQWDICIYLS